ncbi:hypothetical protein Plhal304r1_c025g0083961 [Plasmopara halstedii]
MAAASDADHSTPPLKPVCSSKVGEQQLGASGTEDAQGTPHSSDIGKAKLDSAVLGGNTSPPTKIARSDFKFMAPAAISQSLLSNNEKTSPKYNCQ